MVAMVVGILGIMGALVWKLTQMPPSTHDVVEIGEIELPKDYEIITVSRSGSSLFLVLENEITGERLLEERNAAQQNLVRTYVLQEAAK